MARAALMAKMIFLSRLCGGEANQRDIKVHSQFLSRLCGGEDVNFSGGTGVVFLSRLCGGEVTLAITNSIN